MIGDLYQAFSIYDRNKNTRTSIYIAFLCCEPKLTYMILVLSLDLYDLLTGLDLWELGYGGPIQLPVKRRGVLVGVEHVDEQVGCVVFTTVIYLVALENKSFGQ